MKKIGIIGAGWLGYRLAKYFNERFEIRTTTRSADKYQALREAGFHPTQIEFPGDQVLSNSKPWRMLEQIDILIVTVNFSKRTDIAVLQNRFKNVSSFLHGFKNQMFLMSSIGIYPQVEGEIDEETLNDNELQPNIWSVEQQMKTDFPQINILRLGGLMGDERYLSKYKISETSQVANHVHYEDIALVIHRMIEKGSRSKIYNVVAPEHPTKQAILDQQLGNTPGITDQPFGRVVSTQKLQKELGYTYSKPDPRFFK